MKNDNLNDAIEKLQKEIQYLYTDYKRMLNQYESVNDLKTLRIKIKHAEESLRLKKRIRHISLN